jgi:hypothetical protein
VTPRKEENAVRTINLKNVPKHPNPAQLDEIMCQVSEQLDEGRWTSVRAFGYWYFYHTDEDGAKVTVPKFQSRRQFSAALADATNATVVNDIPFV